MNQREFIRLADAILPTIDDLDVRICWGLLTMNPQEMSYLDDWIDYLRSEEGCSGFDTLQMDILYSQHRDRVTVAFLQEQHECNRFGLLLSLENLREKCPATVEMRG